MRHRIGFCLFLLLVAACSSEPPHESSLPDGESLTSLAGATIVAIGEEPDQLVPQLARSGSSAMLWPWILPSLVRIETEAPDGPAFVGDAAADWEIAADGLSARFVLDASRLWEDTTAVDVNDVIESYRLYRDRRVAGFWPQRLLEISDVSADLEPRVVRFRYRRPLSRSRILQLAALPLISADDWSRNRDRRPRLGTQERPILCAGPFRIGEWHKGAYLRLERHPFPPSERRPRAEEIILRFIPSGRSRAVQFEQGTVAWAVDLPVEEAIRLSEGPKGSGILMFDPGRIETLVFQLTDPTWGRIELRRFLARSLDRDGFRDLLAAEGGRAIEEIPQGFPSFLTEWDDSDERVTLPPDLQLELLYDLTDLRHERLAVEMGLQLERLGMTARLVPRQTTEYLARLRDGRFQAALLAWGSPVLEDVGEIYGSGEDLNFSCLDDPSLDAMIAAARSAGADSIPDRWAKVVRKAGESVPLIYLGRSVRFDGFDPRVAEELTATKGLLGNLLRLPSVAALDSIP